MKIFTVDNWQDQARANTPVSPASCPYVGIAIGPASEEALVRVNGVLLQAGRVLPLVSGQYTIDRENNPPPGGSGWFQSITRLQLMLFEHRDELAAEVARPNGYHTAQITSAGSLASVIVVPTIGRRQVHFSIGHTGDISRVVVTGTRVGRLGVAPHQVVIVDDSTARPAGDPFSFYVGGTNEAENWVEMELEVNSTAGLTQAQVETIGEIGCR